MKTIAVIGAGIVGSFLAYDLTQYEEVEVILFEKHGDVAQETSKANSAIVHAGYDPVDGTLKAKLNKRGAKMYQNICKQLGCGYQACGGYVLASNEEEVEILQELYARGKKRGITVEIKEREEVVKNEKNLSKHIHKALWVPDTAIITPWEVCEALVEEALWNGLQLHLHEEVLDIKACEKGYVIRSDKGQYSVDMLVNAAGLGAQKIMEMVEAESLFTITPKRGQYYVLAKRSQPYVSHVLYPAPSKAGKGVLAVPTIYGNILLGPTSEILKKVDNATTTSGLQEVQEKVEKIIQHVPYQEVIHSYSGCRPTGNNNDFYIEESRRCKGIFHLGCIDSPGLASAPAISEYVIVDLMKLPLTFHKKKHIVHRQKPLIMRNLSETKQQALIQKHPGYGHIVCYCEQISEQEVVDCIHRKCGAHSIAGVKMRVRPGMGKCQGGYCEVEIAKLLARELQIPLHEVQYDEDSYYEVAKEGRR